MIVPIGAFIGIKYEDGHSFQLVRNGNQGADFCDYGNEPLSPKIGEELLYQLLKKSD